MENCKMSGKKSGKSQGILKWMIRGNPVQNTLIIQLIYSQFWVAPISEYYRISSVIRRSFFSFQNNPKDLDPSYKTDLDLWDYLGRVKLLL